LTASELECTTIEGTISPRLWACRKGTVA
jgi:hypothetical protein